MTLQEFIDTIEALGFRRAGSTVGMPSGHFSYIPGGPSTCTNWATREKWARGEQRITVGKRTICIYCQCTREAHMFQNISTKEITGDALIKALDAIKHK